MALIILVMAFGDHPKLFRAYRQQSITLDAAIPDETTLHTRLENLLGARVHSLTITKLDLVNDTTVVDVRYRVVSRTQVTSADDTAPADRADTFEGAQR
jgi:hypothetical protein